MPDKAAFVAASTNPVVAIVLIFAFVLIEWHGREHQYALSRFAVRWYKPARWAFYYILIIAVFLFMGREQQFIYFQF
jgi:alginate O-acetyltransferase complex protein AlgI